MPDSPESLPPTAAEDGGVARWPRIVPWIAPGILCVVAVVQMVLAQTADLSPWKGGGFGMFSTLDNPQSRPVEIAMVRGNQRRPVPTRALDRYSIVRTQSLPSPRNLRRLAREIELRLPASRGADIRIEISKTFFDGETSELEAVPWKSAVVHPDGAVEIE